MAKKGFIILQQAVIVFGILSTSLQNNIKKIIISTFDNMPINKVLRTALHEVL